jgi:hypothetical protein
VLPRPPSASAPTALPGLTGFTRPRCAARMKWRQQVGADCRLALELLTDPRPRPAAVSERPNDHPQPQPVDASPLRLKWDLHGAFEEIHLVDYEAGTYRAEGGGGCYWERLKSPSGKLSDIIANGGFNPNQTLVIAIRRSSTRRTAASGSRSTSSTERISAVTTSLSRSASG